MNMTPTKRLSPSEFRDLLMQLVQKFGTSVENSGIGHYEYWGAKCFDRGHDFLIYNGFKTMTFPVSSLTRRTIDAVWGEDIDFHHTFIEGDMDLTIQVRARVREDNVCVTITELD